MRHARSSPSRNRSAGTTSSRLKRIRRESEETVYFPFFLAPFFLTFKPGLADKSSIFRSPK